MKPEPPRYGPCISASEHPDRPHWQAVQGRVSLVLPGELISFSPFGRPVPRATPLIQPLDGQLGQTGRLRSSSATVVMTKSE